VEHIPTVFVPTVLASIAHSGNLPVCEETGIRSARILKLAANRRVVVVTVARYCSDDGRPLVAVGAVSAFQTGRRFVFNRFFLHVAEPTERIIAIFKLFAQVSPILS
jgi:hypothetical protein